MMEKFKFLVDGNEVATCEADSEARARIAFRKMGFRVGKVVKANKSETDLWLEAWRKVRQWETYINNIGRINASMGESSSIGSAILMQDGDDGSRIDIDYSLKPSDEEFEMAGKWDILRGARR